MSKDRVSDREAREAFGLYVQATGKSMEDTLNRAAGNAAFAAMKHIPPAKLQEINVHNPRGKIGTDYQRRLFHALATKEGVPKGQGNMAQALKIFNGRKRSRGFVSAIFINMARDFGRKVTRTKGMGPKAAESFGRKADARSLVAFMESGTVDVEVTDLLYTAYFKGLKTVIADMTAYAKKKLDKQDAKHGARKR